MTMWLVQLFAEHGLDLLLGSTALLGLGALAMLLHERPIHVQRMGELTLLGVMAWTVLAVVPMPRFDWEDAFRSSETSPERQPGSESFETERVADDEFAMQPIGTARPSLEWRTPVEPVGVVALEQVADAPVELATHAASELSAPVEPMSTEAAHPVVSDAPVDLEQAGVAAAPLMSADSSVPWSKLGAAFFLGGSALAAGYLLLGFYRLRRILARATPAPPWVRQLLAADASFDDAYRNLPRVLVSDQRCGPFCVGVFRPTIVLPSALVARRSSAVRHVLLHEIAHARQGDGRGQLLVALALPVLWFHPLYWWVRKRVRFAAELVADDQAAGIVPRGTYARELIGLAETGWPSSPSPIASPTILRSPSEFSRRIEMLLSRTDRLSTRCSTARRRVQALAACGLVALTTGFFGAPPLHAQDTRDYERLMAEKESLMEQMQEMRAMMNELRAQVEQARVAEQLSDGELAKQAAEALRYADEHQDALHEMQILQELAITHRQDAQAQRNDALALREFLEQQIRQSADQQDDAAQLRGRLGRLVEDDAHLADVAAAERALEASLGSVDAKDEYVEFLSRKNLADAQEALSRGKGARSLYTELAKEQAIAAARQAQGLGDYTAAATEYRLAQQAARSHAAAQGPFGGIGGVGGGSGSSGGRSQGTMNAATLELVTSYIDLDGEIRMAQLDLARMEDLVVNAVVNEAEVTQRRVTLETLERKKGLMRSLLVSELRATELELSDAAEQAGSSGSGRAWLMRLQSRMEIIANTLDMGGSGGQGSAR